MGVCKDGGRVWVPRFTLRCPPFAVTTALHWKPNTWTPFTGSVLRAGEDSGSRQTLSLSPWCPVRQRRKEIKQSQCDGYYTPKTGFHLCFLFVVVAVFGLSCGILLLWPGIEPRPMAVKVLSPNPSPGHEAREFPHLCFFMVKVI